MTLLHDLMKQASQFVEQHKGAWDHNAWLNFISDIRKTGYELTEDTTEYLGQVLESIKQLYSTLPMGIWEEKKEEAEKTESLKVEKEKQSAKQTSPKPATPLKVKPLKTTRLTKSFLMELEEGLFLASNVFHDDGIPIYAEIVSSSAKREEQWKQIRDVSANHRSCSVFKSKEEFESYHTEH